MNRNRAEVAQTARFCGLRLFVDKGYPMGRPGPCQGRDADHKNGGPLYLLAHEPRRVPPLSALLPPQGRKRYQPETSRRRHQRDFTLTNRFGGIA